MNAQAKAQQSVAAKSDTAKHPDRQREEFVKPEVKSWGSVAKVTGFTF